MNIDDRMMELYEHACHEYEIEYRRGKYNLYRVVDIGAGEIELRKEVKRLSPEQTVEWLEAYCLRLGMKI